MICFNAYLIKTVLMNDPSCKSQFIACNGSGSPAYLHVLMLWSILHIVPMSSDSVSDPDPFCCAYLRLG